ncbi:MAG: dihydropteroate synthase, partial [Nocardioidaceae bacterium]
MFSAPARYVAGLPQPRRCLVMGVVNVTPDSFSDGGMWFEPSEAIRHGMSLLDQGADLIDVGGESTRPGAQRTTMDDELRRVLPVVSPLAEADALVSIDTMRAEVARQAVAAGAVAINDVSGGLADPDMMATAAELEVPYVCMHWRGHSASMQQRARYDDVVSEVAAELGQRADAAVAAGISSERLVLDPGLGFAKTGEHNWQLLQQLEDLQALGFPILVAASRKGFLGTLLAEPDGPK